MDHSALETRCLAAAESLANRFRRSSPPFSLEPLLEHFGVTHVRERPLDRDACLKWDSGRLVIEVNSLYSLAFRRAAIAHEIGHLIVAQCSGNGGYHWGHDDKEVEILCDRLAGELLAPNWAVCRYTANTTAGGTGRRSRKRASLRKAASIFRVPVETLRMLPAS